MLKKSLIMLVAGCFCLSCAEFAAAGAAPVVSNKPLSASVAANNVTQYTVSSNIKKSVKTKKNTDKQIKKTAKQNKPADIKVKQAAVFANVQLPENYQDISIYGEAEATKAQAVALIKQYNPEVKLECSVEELVDIYWQEAEREGVRPDLALSQALVETGFFKYGGDVHHNQNNFCGLGTTGNGVKGASFKTPEIGVRAHIQHLLAYTQKKRPSTKIVDPRYELAHRIRLERGVVDTWYGLNGTWAMGSNYCEKIMVNYQRMLAMSAEDDKLSEKETDKKDKDKQKEKYNSHRMRDLVEKLLKER